MHPIALFNIAIKSIITTFYRKNSTPGFLRITLGAFNIIRQVFQLFRQVIVRTCIYTFFFTPSIIRCHSF